MAFQSREAHHQHRNGDVAHMHADDSAAGVEISFTAPVCGMKVGADPARSIAHAGQDYFFCSVGCMAKFRSNPQSYLDKTETPELAVSREGTIFTCPMHPKIRKPRQAVARYAGRRWNR